MVTGIARASRVMIAGGGRGSGMAFIRSLARQGWDVVAADSERSPGLYSRHVSTRVRYPSPAIAPEEAVRALLSAARRLRVDLIIPVTDDVILPLAHHRSQFVGVSALALPPNELIAVASSKIETARLATRLRVPSPRAEHVLTTEEAVRVAPNLGWPLVLKP